ncbi:MAG: DNA repair protein RadA, partial [Candidatus Levybacteria bacterium]|nr:DNA repair protein RadA [Candidatus Levybacteria bacterium]
AVSASVGTARKSQKYGTVSSTIEPKKVSEVPINTVVRVSTGFSEFDRVLGQEAKSGIVPGSVILLSGDPGVGKSTILLQTALNLAFQNKKILYVTGEESEAQVTMRAKRLLSTKDLKDASLYILATSDIDAALLHAERESYDLVIIDSIQTMEGGNVPGYAGSIPQVRHATGRLVSFAKGTNIPVILIGHVTKEGMVAGPQMLSHMVDAVLYLEGEKMTGVRILRSFKNRFGDTSEVGIFEMNEYGMKEVTDLSELFLGNVVTSPGSCVAVVMEGSRPILVEIQALTISSNLPYPRRVASGISEKRLELLLAILQKHAKIPLEKFDVFINVVGGFKVTETAADLAVCMAILSSFKGKPLSKVAAIAEVGLLGEIKKVVNLKKREQEASKFKFKVLTYESASSISGILAKL